MRVLVTGAAGLLGRAVAARLAPRHEVVGLDRRPAPHVAHVGDITDRDVVEEACSGCDAVVHTASLHAPHVATHPRRAFVEVNVLGTLTLLEAAAAAGARRFVYTSTTSLYGHALEPEGEAVWVTEALVPAPRDVYDVTKVAAEQLCRDVARAGTGPTCVTLRVARFFPESDRSTAVHRLHRGVDVRDAAAAHELALTAPVATYDVFNVSARTPFTRGEAGALLDDAAGVIRQHHPAIAEGFRRRGWALPERIDRVYVAEKAERGLGYAPRHNVAEVLRGDGRAR